ncbi:translation termination factor GTPase eRF3 [Thoreauomyces humboldtii]|nr:translation termination factor GTPase eRF3 [Thoreauomyces humboldtii]
MSNGQEEWAHHHQQQQQQEQSDPSVPTQQFNRMNVNQNNNQQQRQQSAGAGRGSHSFAKTYNTGAAEFVPSWGGQDTYQAPQASSQQYQQQAYQQPYNGGYQGQQGGYQNQGYNQRQQAYDGYNQGYDSRQQGGGYQQGGYQQRQQGYNQGYDSRQQQYQAPQQQAYQAPAPRAAPAPRTVPAKAVSISIGGPKPTTETAPAPAKAVSISIGGAAKPKDAPAAKSISLSIGEPAKPKEAAPEKPVEEEAVPASEDAQTSSAPTPEPESAPAPAETEAATPAPAEPAAAVPTPAPAAPEAVVEDEPEEEEEDEPEEEGKEHLNIVFIGHVDAGKSTMGGHLLFLTGMVDKRTMEKYEREAKELGRESWYLSWALDLNQEERNKGKTTEYGRGYFETEKRRFTILDAPGHKNFIPSMIGGASQADVGVLVLSARKGEFESGFDRGGQTREHAMLAKTAGVKRLIVVVNKMDEPTVAWSKERFDEIIGKVMPFLKQVGFNPKTDLDVVPVSGFTGANLKDKVDSKTCDWYTGPSLINLLDDMVIADRGYNRPFMMPVADKFKEMGTVVTGKIESGRIRKGQRVILMPNKQKAEISAILSEDQELTSAKSGDNVRLRLRGIEEEDILPGFVLCSPKNPVHAVTVFEAQLSIIEYKSIMCAGYSAVMHAHTCVEEVTITDLLHSVDKKTGKKTRRPPQFLKQNDAAIVRITTSQPICLETYADHPQLGRFTLRDEGKTIAIGKVTKLVLDE